MAKQNSSIRRDPTLKAIERAMRRASDRAYARAIETGTPFIVYKNGKIVDLNRGAKPKKIVRDLIW